MPEPLPCPFCGTVPEVIPAIGRGFFICCENEACPISPETPSLETEAQVIECWNTRPTPAQAA